MKRPMILFAAAVLSGILTGLPEVPVLTRAAAAMAAAALLSYFYFSYRGKLRVPLYFLCITAILLFAAGFYRGSQTADYYASERFQAFYRKYEATNPGEFDYALYLKSLDITDEEERLRYKNRTADPESGFSVFLSSAVSSADLTLKNSLTEHDYGIWKAVLLGDRSSMKEEVKDLYQEAGIAHLLAVSGIHVSLVGMGLYALLRRKLKLNLWISLGASLCSALFYVLLTGSSGSSLRALIMLGVSLFCVPTGRKYDPASALSLSAILLVFWRPYLLLQSGFQLSFTALSGICISSQLQDHSRKKEEKRKSLFRSVIGMLHAQAGALQSSVCVSLLTLPVIAACYYYVPVYSIFLNLAVIPLMSVLMISGFCTLASGYLCAAAGTGSFYRISVLLRDLCIAPGHYVMKFYETLSSLSMKLPGARFLVGAPESLSVIIYYVFLALLYLFFRHRNKTPGVLLPMLIFIYMISFRFLSLRPAEDNQVIAFDSGQGDSFLIRAGESCILIDCGSSGYERVGSRIVEPYLLSKGIRKLDVAVVSHADWDHCNGVIYLLEESEIEIGTLMLPALAAIDSKYDTLKAAADGIPVLYAQRGTSCSSGSAELRCLYSETDPAACSDTNRESSVFLLNLDGYRMLFTGDMTEKEERKLLELEGSTGALKTDLLKCSHHGSSSASSLPFLIACDPSLTLLSYGENNRYGHPSAEVTERLTALSLPYCSTAEWGAVIVKTGKGGVSVSGFLEGQALLRISGVP